MWSLVVSFLTWKPLASISVRRWSMDTATRRFRLPNPWVGFSQDIFFAGWASRISRVLLPRRYPPPCHQTLKTAREDEFSVFRVSGFLVLPLFDSLLSGSSNFWFSVIFCSPAFWFSGCFSSAGLAVTCSRFASWLLKHKVCVYY